MRRCLECGQEYRGSPVSHRLSEKHFWGQATARGDCWEWDGNRTAGGYGMTKQGSAHRRAWVYKNGPIPKGLMVLHRCDNPPCIRPEHLFVGTHADNMADMVAKGRQAHGPRITRAHYETWDAYLLMGSMLEAAVELGIHEITVRRRIADLRDTFGVRNNAQLAIVIERNRAA